MLEGALLARVSPKAPGRRQRHQSTCRFLLLPRLHGASRALLQIRSLFKMLASYWSSILKIDRKLTEHKAHLVEEYSSVVLGRSQLWATSTSHH